MKREIVVTSKTQTIIVEGRPPFISVSVVPIGPVGPAGVPGPEGPEGPAGSGGSSLLMFRDEGTFSHSGSDFGIGDYTSVINAVVPEEGNIYAIFFASGVINWKTSGLVGTSQLAYFDYGWEVDGYGPGVNTFFEQRNFPMTPINYTTVQGVSICTIACPGAATRVIKVNTYINSDSGAGFHNNVLSVSMQSECIAMFVPGTHISDGSGFTP